MESKGHAFVIEIRKKIGQKYTQIKKGRKEKRQHQKFKLILYQVIKANTIFYNFKHPIHFFYHLAFVIDHPIPLLLYYLINILISQQSKLYLYYFTLLQPSNNSNMFTRLLSPFKNIKTQKSIQKQKPNQEPLQELTHFSVVYRDPINEQGQILYTTPKSCLGNGDKVFHPQQWDIKKFEIGRPLGRGKFGHVYLARQKVSKHIVAIKVLSKKQIINSDVIGQIRRQIQIHTHLDHPNILKMFGFFFDERKIYYIMQYATGGQLYKVLKKQNKFGEKQVARYIKQMTSALIHIHQSNVIHRDIKPENILLCSDDQLKISDFGWSVRALSTRRKTMCGTMDYLCPQIVQHKYYDNSVDIWALGVLTYELSTGNAPFYNKDRALQYKNIKTVNIKYPQYLSEQIVDFIGKLLQKNPNDRMKLQDALNHPWLKNNI